MLRCNRNMSACWSLRMFLDVLECVIVCFTFEFFICGGISDVYNLSWTWNWLRSITRNVKFLKIWHHTNNVMSNRNKANHVTVRRSYIITINWRSRAWPFVSKYTRISIPNSKLFDFFPWFLVLEISFVQIFWRKRHLQTLDNHRDDGGGLIAVDVRSYRTNVRWRHNF
jgi:hypothetical protein